MRFGINTFLFTSPFTTKSTSLFPKFKKWGFDTVELPIEAPEHIDSEKVKKAQDFQEGRVKHIKVAIEAAMTGEEPEASIGMDYLKRLVKRQVDAGADFLDLNIDEISLKIEEQKVAIKWLVETVEELSSVPLSIDSSKSEIIEEGLKVCRGKAGQMMLNSA